LTQSENNTKMSALFLLIGISLLVASGFLVAFLWSVQNGQFDDTQTPSVRMLFDRAESHSTSKAHGNEEVLKKA
jgi:cbb3-type cytochrome oxidase maturation protein